MVILLCYTLAFSEVIYMDFYAKILDWNFPIVDENSQILVVFISKLNFSFSFRFVDENCGIFVVVFVTKIRPRKFPFSSSLTKKRWYWPDAVSG